MVFSEPYPCPSTARQRWLISLAVGSGVFIFLFLFQPFGLGEQRDHPMAGIAAGYGLITLLVTLFNQFVAPASFPGFFNEKSWSVGKHLLFSSWIFFTVGAVNFLYSHYLGFVRLNLPGFFYFQLVTLLVGIFPVSVLILVNYAYLLRRNLHSAVALEHALRARPPGKAHETERVIDIPSENKGEQLQLNLNDLLYLASADNYVEVCYIDGKETRKKMLRNTLSRMESLFRTYPMLYRCHRTYLVNLQKIVNITGNSQGCRLVLEGTEETIPVSRSHYKRLLQKLDTAT